MSSPGASALRTSTCPVARATAVVGDRWSLLIVREAYDGARRFNDFQRRLGMAKNILSGRLRALVADGVLETTPAADGGPYHEYRLTEAGLDLFPVLVALRQWGEAHAFAEGEPRSELVDDRAGRPVVPLRVVAADGRPVDATTTVVRKPRTAA
ncbi:MAG TPA: helix-turn-helix domain-containing protein [Solirubrobacteraceae bacterium]|nr:helix-turn-helix domain-containing protein [Solirubrobacteraceae bacterium]